MTDKQKELLEKINEHLLSNTYITSSYVGNGAPLLVTGISGVNTVMPSIECWLVNDAYHVPMNLVSSIILNEEKS